MKKSLKICEFGTKPCHWSVLECPDNVICPQPLPDNDNPVLLGPKTFWWKIRVILLTPFWLFSIIDPERPTKSWSEYKYGLIKHTCVWNEEKPEKDQYCTWLPCKHHGCNLIHVVKYS